MKKIWTAAFLCAAALASAQTDNIDSVFDDPEASVITQGTLVENPDAKIFGENPFMWAGDFTPELGVQGGWEKLPPQAGKFSDNLLLDIDARLWFDARPDKNYRVFGKFTTSYPFSTDLSNQAVVPGSTTSESYSVNNIKVFELFADFNWQERFFFRFGKQTTSWGMSRFYQIADPISVGVKDPNDLTQDIEGPVALKMSMPFGVNNLYFYTVIKKSYLPALNDQARVRDLGVGLKADFYVRVPENKTLGNADVTFGVYYQRKLAPKAIAGLSTSVGKFQIFTDQVLSWGLDSYRLTGKELLAADIYGTGSPVVIYETEKPGNQLFYSATLGTMYVNNDWHFTLYGEYLFNAAASRDPDYLKNWEARYAAEQIPATGADSTLAISDAAGYLSMHNSGVSVTWSELFNTDKISFSTAWFQNWIDLSGMIRPTLTLIPFTHLQFDIGTNVSWGSDTSEWVLKTSNPSSLKPNRLTGFLKAKIGIGKF